jgi:hypothetical protein
MQSQSQFDLGIKNMKKLIFLTFSFCWLAFHFPLAAFAQETGLKISLSRDFGYSSGTGRIQGMFTIHVKGPENLTRVVFFMDGKPMGEDTEAPFKLQFDTGQFSLGEHVIRAVGTTSDGQELPSNEIRATFATPEESWQVGAAILVPVLGLVVGIMALTFVVSMVSARRRGALPLGMPRNYGLKGGTICPKCRRPFALHLFAFNLFTHVFDFCPHCGKWSLLRPLPNDLLRQAEATELTWERPGEAVRGMSEEEKLKKELDDSRYQGT